MKNKCLYFLFFVILHSIVSFGNETFTKIGKKLIAGKVEINLADNFERFLYIKEWNRLYVFNKLPSQEDTFYEFNIYDPNGTVLNERSVIKKYLGEIKNFICLLPKEKILIAQISSHHKVNKSYLLNKNGKMLREINQSTNVLEISKSQDDELFWIQSRHMNGLQDLWTEISYYDSDGNLLTTKKYKRELIDTSFYKRKKYNIKVIKPEIPG